MSKSHGGSRLGNPNGKRGGSREGAGAKPKSTFKANGKVAARVPPAWQPTIASHGLAAVLDTQRDTAKSLIAAARRVLAEPLDEERQTELEGRIEEMADVLREFGPKEGAIVV